MKLMAKHRARQGLPQPSSSVTKSAHMRPLGHTADWRALVPSEAELLNDIALRLVANEALYTICRDLTNRGIPTVREKPSGVLRICGNAVVSPHGGQARARRHTYRPA